MSYYGPKETYLGVGYYGFTFPNDIAKEEFINWITERDDKLEFYY
jgi:hypothetical protein